MYFWRQFSSLTLLKPKIKCYVVILSPCYQPVVIHMGSELAIVIHILILVRGSSSSQALKAFITSTHRYKK